MFIDKNNWDPVLAKLKCAANEKKYVFTKKIFTLLTAKNR